MDIKSQFKGIDNAKITERGSPQTAISEKQEDGTVKYAPAEYDLEVLNCTTIRAREGFDAFIVKFKVLSSSNPDIKVGDTRTWFQKLADRDVGLGAVKAFCLATLGIDLSDKDGVQEASESLPDLMEAIVGDDQEFAGEKVHVRVDVIKTVKKGINFNRHQFSPANA